jgi:hypothetical protein
VWQLGNALGGSGLLLRRPHLGPPPHLFLFAALGSLFMVDLPPR